MQKYYRVILKYFGDDDLSEIKEDQFIDTYENRKELISRFIKKDASYLENIKDFINCKIDKIEIPYSGDYDDPWSREIMINSK